VPGWSDVGLHHPDGCSGQIASLSAAAVLEGPFAASSMIDSRNARRCAMGKLLRAGSPQLEAFIHEVSPARRERMQFFCGNDRLPNAADEVDGHLDYVARLEPPLELGRFDW